MTYNAKNSIYGQENKFEPKNIEISEDADGESCTDDEISEIAKQFNINMFSLCKEIHRQNFKGFEKKYKKWKKLDSNEQRILLCRICDTNFHCIKVQIAFVKLLVEKDIGICFKNYNDSNEFIIEHIFFHCNINVFNYFFEIMSNDQNLMASLKDIFARYFQFEKPQCYSYIYDKVPLFSKIFENDEFCDRFVIFHNSITHVIKREDNKSFLLNINENKFAAVSFLYSVYRSDHKNCKYLLDSGISVTNIENILHYHFKIQGLSILHILFSGHPTQDMFTVMYILLMRGINICRYTVSGKSILEHAVALNFANYLVVWPFVFLQKHLAAKRHIFDSSKDLSLLGGHFNGACIVELERLKSHLISENVSLFYILRQSIYSLVYVLDNKPRLFYNLNFDDIAEKYRLFGDYIITKVLLICERKKYLDLARPTLSFIYNNMAKASSAGYIPSPITEKIENYLSISDLNLFKIIVKKPISVKARCSCKNYLSRYCFCNDRFWIHRILLCRM